MSSRDELYVYEWNAGDGSLLFALCPDAVDVPATLGEDYLDVLARIPEVRGGWFVFHVNLTDTSSTPRRRNLLCRELHARGVEVINGNATDISKRRVQSACRALGLPAVAAVQDADPNELLIVKTDRNCNGIGEAMASAEEACRLGLQDPALGVERFEYRILPRKDVGRDVWDCKSLVVERYISNSQDLLYTAYMFLDRMVISLVTDPEPLKKMPAGIPRINWFYTLPGMQMRGGDAAPPPRKLLEDAVTFRSALGLDLCVLDIVPDDEGGFYIVDVNTTPFFRDTGQPELLRFLASALTP